MGEEKANNIEYIGESNGNMPTYKFATNASTKIEEKESKVNMEITKINGHIVWMLDNRLIDHIGIEMEEAKGKGKEFLQSRGIDNMKETYFIINNGVATINYAYIQDDIIMYPDLIKVKVALDNGDIIGFESKGYIMSHQDKRKLTNIKISEEEAGNKINPRLSITSKRLAVIPLESKKEVLCYEFAGTYNERDFLIYINVETGKEEQILLLLKMENGTLTI